MGVIILTLRKFISKVQLDVFSESQFFTLLIKLVQKHEVIIKVFCGMFFCGEEKLCCTEFDLEDFLYMVSALVKENILIFPTAIKLFIDLQSQHQDNISETTLPELLRRHAIKPYHHPNIFLIHQCFLRLKLQQLVHKYYPAAYCEELDWILWLVDSLIDLLSL